ncbi:MAG: N-acetylglucosamine kinase [Flavobacteriaceae bacterium]
MILIADSGSTKADFVALNNKGSNLFMTETLGLNPEVLTKEEIFRRLNQRFDILHNKEKVEKLFFYGAGCGTDRMKNYLDSAFREYFPNAMVSVLEDTYAAAYATNPTNEKAIICILGTGSNCSYFDGKTLIQKVQSLGYIAMDDASGNHFGKELIRQYYFNKMPKHLAEKFQKEYDLDADVIKENFYKKPNPNAYLASFAKFLISHKNEPVFQKIIFDELELFIENYIKQFEDYKEVQVHFIGSIAFYLKEELQTALTKHNIKLGNVLRRPMDGLVEYHKINL